MNAPRGNKVFALLLVVALFAGGGGAGAGGHTEGCVPVVESIKQLVAGRFFPRVSMTGQLYDEYFDDIPESFIFGVNQDTGQWKIIEITDEIACEVAGGVGVQIVIMRERK